MSKFSMVHALNSLKPTAMWSFEEETYESLVWLSDNIRKPTKREIEDEIARLESEELARLENEALAEQAKAEALQSAVTKLAKLGLSEDEAKALAGL